MKCIQKKFIPIHTDSYLQLIQTLFLLFSDYGMEQEEEEVDFDSDEYSYDSNYEELDDHDWEQIRQEFKDFVD